MIDAGATADLVRSGRTTAVEQVEQALERADAAEDLNTFTRLDPGRARDRAATIDEQVAAGRDPGPLAGVPIALKDLIDQRGIATTAGSSFLREPAGADATVTRRLEAAGAVVIGRTGLHEFAYGFSSENDWWGAVRNPWDPATSPGGSSGGSAAAVAAGVVPLAIGTDTGGSVRVPAALCGVAGLKVTHGRIPLTGVFPLAASLDSVGPIARTVADLELAFGVLAGHDPSDPWSRDHPVGPAPRPRLEEMTIGVPHPWVDRVIAPEQAAGFARCIAMLEAAGARVAHLDEPVLDQRDLHPGTYHEVASVHRDWFASDPGRYGPAIRERLKGALSLGPDDIAAGALWREAVTMAFARALERCDLLLTPATAARTKPIGVDLLDVGAGPEPYRPVVSWFTPLVNQAGLPALVVPVEDPDVAGLPPSVQLIGPAWSEPLLLGFGLECDRIGLVAHRSPPTVAPET